MIKCNIDEYWYPVYQYTNIFPLNIPPSISKQFFQIKNISRILFFPFLISKEEKSLADTWRAFSPD